MCKEVSTNAECSDIVCDTWLRFTLKGPKGEPGAAGAKESTGEELVHKAVKIRKKLSEMVADVLQSRVVSFTDIRNSAICPVHFHF